MTSAEVGGRESLEVVLHIKNSIKLKYISVGSIHLNLFCIHDLSSPSDLTVIFIQNMCPQYNPVHHVHNYCESMVCSSTPDLTVIFLHTHRLPKSTLFYIYILTYCVSMVCPSPPDLTVIFIDIVCPWNVPVHLSLQSYSYMICAHSLPK